MRKLTFVLAICAVIALGTAFTYIITKFSPPAADIQQPAQIPTQIPSQTQISTVPSDAQPTQTTASCQQNQLSSSLTTQGAAGNIYGQLAITNTGKVPCDIVLGDTVTLELYGQNITKHYQDDVPTQHFTLAPSEKVYSQIHYPNGPQCQSGITQKQTTFLYFIPQTSVSFDLTTETKLVIPVCNSESEITTIDIWPLSKNPVTQ